MKQIPFLMIGLVVLLSACSSPSWMKRSHAYLVEEYAQKQNASFEKSVLDHKKILLQVGFEPKHGSTEDCRAVEAVGSQYVVFAKHEVVVLSESQLALKYSATTQRFMDDGHTASYDPKASLFKHRGCIAELIFQRPEDQAVAFQYARIK